MSTDKSGAKKPRTEKQKEASRANGARSGGAHSGQTHDPVAERYGRLAQVLLLPAESRKVFMTLAGELVESLQPQTPIQHLLIGKMLAAHWRQNRLWGAGSAPNPQGLADENRLDRQFYRAYDRYFRHNKNIDPPNNPSDSLPDSYSHSGGPPEPEETREAEPAPPEPAPSNIAEDHCGATEAILMNRFDRSEVETVGKDYEGGAIVAVNRETDGAVGAAFSPPLTSASGSWSMVAP